MTAFAQPANLVESVRMNPLPDRVEWLRDLPNVVSELTLTSRKPSRSPLIRYRTRALVRVAAGTAEAPTRISQIPGQDLARCR